MNFKFNLFDLSVIITNFVDCKSIKYFKMVNLQICCNYSLAGVKFIFVTTIEKISSL